VEESALPGRLALGPAQPNPMVSEARFAYALPRDGRVVVALFDSQGQRVRDLLNGFERAGEHRVNWDGLDNSGRRVSSGLYICRMETGGRTLSRRIVAVH